MTKPEAPIKITIHAYERAFKRLNWTRHYVKTISAIAFERGVDYDSAKGKLKTYIKEKEEKNKREVIIKVLNETVFIFQANSLVTVFELPKTLKRCYGYSKQKLNCPE